MSESPIDALLDALDALDLHAAMGGMWVQNRRIPPL